VGDTYGKVSEQALQQWHLERARILFSIQNEMTPEERLSKRKCYWVHIDGKRFLQIVVFNESHYRVENSVDMPVLREQLNLPERPGVAEIFKRMDTIEAANQQEAKVGTDSDDD
jgi:hypothetical protein